MSGNWESPDAEPKTVTDWFSAVVHSASRWDVALAIVPLAVVFGVLLGSTSIPMWTGVTAGTGIALAAMGYVVAVEPDH